jgi:hypothetical protein
MAHSKSTPQYMFSAIRIKKTRRLLKGFLETDLWLLKSPYASGASLYGERRAVAALIQAALAVVQIG